MEALNGRAVHTQIAQRAVRREQMLEIQDILQDRSTVSCGHDEGQLGLPYPCRIDYLLVIAYGPCDHRHRTTVTHRILVLKRVRTETVLEHVIQHNRL